MANKSSPSKLANDPWVYVALAGENESAMAAGFAAAHTLAQATRGALAGVWLEDSGLADLARLPFARQVLPTGQTRPPLDPAQIERYLQTRADRARAAFERISGSEGLDFHRLRCPHTISGIFSTLDTSAKPAFLVHAPVMPNAAGKAPRRSQAPAKTVSASERPPAVATSPDLAVVFDGSPTSERAFGLALDLTQAHGKARLMVLLIPDLPGEKEQVIRRLVAGHPQVLLVRMGGPVMGRGALRRDLALPAHLRLSGHPRETLVRALHGLDVAAVLLPATYEALLHEPLPELARACRRPVVVVR